MLEMTSSDEASTLNAAAIFVALIGFDVFLVQWRFRKFVYPGARVGHGAPVGTLEKNGRRHDVPQIALDSQSFSVSGDLFSDWIRNARKFR